MVVYSILYRFFLLPCKSLITVSSKGSKRLQQEYKKSLIKYHNFFLSSATAAMTSRGVIL